MLQSRPERARIQKVAEAKPLAPDSLRQGSDLMKISHMFFAHANSSEGLGEHKIVRKRALVMTQKILKSKEYRRISAES